MRRIMSVAVLVATASFLQSAPHLPTR